MFEYPGTEPPLGYQYTAPNNGQQSPAAAVQSELSPYDHLSAHTIQKQLKNHPKTTLIGWCVSTWPPLTLRTI